MTEQEKFDQFREKMNKVILEEGDLNTKRFFNLDNKVYAEGELSAKTKELLGLTASLVLRCDDCIRYHLVNAAEAGWSKKEIYEAFNVALLVGGSIVIPHLRRAAEILENYEFENGAAKEKTSSKNQITEVKKYQLYTDGACSGNPGPGGYAALILENGEEELDQISGSAEDTTNNRMELKAVIEGLKRIPKGSSVELFSDSTYVLKGLSKWLNTWRSNGWKTSAKKNVANRDLWQHLDKLISDYQLEFQKVKSHSGDEYNERVDSLAKNEIKKD